MSGHQTASVFSFFVQRQTASARPCIAASCVQRSHARSNNLDKGPPSVKNNWWQSYNAYLQTEHWARLRESRLRVDRHRCTRCGLGRDLQVHHVRYRDPLWSGRLEDLRTLCKRCHSAAHRRQIGWGQAQRKAPMRAQGCVTLAWVLFWIWVLLVAFGALLHSARP